MTRQPRDVVIVDALRTPIGRARKGSLTDARPEDLLAMIIRALATRQPRAEIDEVIAGCGYPWGEQGYNVARAGSLLAELPVTTPAHTVSRMCASSMEATREAAHTIAMGEADAIVACGVESVSRVGRDRHLADPHPALHSGSDGPTIAEYYMSMLQTAENVALRWRVDRKAMDEYAQRSQELAVAAQQAGDFRAEILPVETGVGTVELDDGPRPDSTLAGLADLDPLIQDGRVTAGNACPLNDGAAGVLLMAEEKAEELGIVPRARVISHAVSAVDPTIMGVGPIEAMRQAAQRAGMRIEDFSAIELNEAFAAQVLPVCWELEVDPFDPRFNGRGGAIALGHPFGQTGVRLVVTLLHRLEQSDRGWGLAGLCVGGGQGQALTIQVPE